MELEIELDEDIFLPKYRALHNSTYDIDFLYGGRDSGKTFFIAQELLLKCLGAKYFKCILIRKTFESIKDSQWETLKKIVEDWGLEDWFTFTESPLKITCKNGNTFIARGCDKPGKLKSIKDPTDAWYEEGNQLDEDDYTIISTTLRSPDGIPVHEWFSFNPECKGNYEDFWLYKTYFSNSTEKSFTGNHTTKVGEVEFTVNFRATHSTYHDNPFCTVDRRAKLENLATSNYYWYQVFTLGEWGNEVNDSPFAYAFSRAKHAIAGLHDKYCNDRSLPLILSWDFNRNPMCCSILQHDKTKREMRFLETLKIPNTGCDELCEMILTKYPGFLYIVTGDYSGHNAQSLYKEQVTNYVVIKSKLKIADTQIKVKTHPRLNKNRTLVNLALQHYGIMMDSIYCKSLVFDLENVKALADGSILKEDRNQPVQQADSLDTFRYAIDLELPDFEKIYLPNSK